MQNLKLTKKEIKTLLYWCDDLEDLNKIKKAIFNMFKKAITQETFEVAESIWIKLQNL